MELKQKTELRRLLIPEVRQSLKILTLPLPELETIVQEELLANPVIEEVPPAQPLETYSAGQNEHRGKADPELSISLLTKQPSLQDVLLTQLRINVETGLEYHIGQEIIENIDDNGYLHASLEDIAAKLGAEAAHVHGILAVIQGFEPAGVAARSVQECLRIQLELAGLDNPLLRKIVDFHLDLISKKRYQDIAKALKEPLEKIEPLIKTIQKLNPKPGRAFSNEEVQRVIPDIFINENLDITINEETIPALMINKTYKEMLKNPAVDLKTKEFIRAKMHNATELLRAIAKRKQTLRKIIEAIIDIQQDAFQNGLENLKPLAFKEIATRLQINESTVCRAVLHKYADTPWGIISLKNFFCSGVQDNTGIGVSSSRIKSIINSLIAQENKQHPLSDQEIVAMIAREHNLNISRRTIAKYREESGIHASSYRREK